MASLKSMTKSQIINFFGDLAIEENFKGMTKKNILKLISDGEIGYGLSITEDVDNWNKGGAVKKKKKMNVGGMMPMQEQKINPTTGLTMKKGGMTDMRKTGMFYGGMVKKKK